jgi:hypothetical protein
MKFEDMILPASLGVGGLLLAPVLLPVATRLVRPILRTVIQAGQEITGELGNMVSDVRAELDREYATAAGPGEGGTSQTATKRAAAAGAVVGGVGGGVSGSTASHHTERRDAAKGERTETPSTADDGAKGKKGERTES